MDHLLADISQPQCSDLQDQGVQRDPLDLGSRVLAEGIVVGLCVHPEADSGARAPCPPLALLGTGTAEPEFLQPAHLTGAVKTHLLHLQQTHEKIFVAIANRARQARHLA